jgi:hypothetical protein
MATVTGLFLGGGEAKDTLFFAPLSSDQSFFSFPFSFPLFSSLAVFFLPIVIPDDDSVYSLAGNRTFFASLIFFHMFKGFFPRS